MRTFTLYRRSLVHHRRAHLATALGVITGTAVLTGALLVGDSMRGSLREAALERLGRIGYTLVAPHLFREALAEELGAATESGPSAGQVSPALLTRGAATHAESGASVERVAVVGVDARFWELDSAPAERRPAPATGRVVLLNEPLASELRAASGDEILLRIGKPAAISTETLLGRRDDTTLTLRLTVRGTVPARGLGAFSLNPRQTTPRNAYVPLATLQRAMQRPARVNSLLVGLGRDRQRTPTAGREALNTLLKRRLQLEDLGLRLRLDPPHDYIALESEAFLIDPALEESARAAATAIARQPTVVLSYLANEIAVESRPEAVIPYSTVAAIELGPELQRAFALTDGSHPPPLTPGEILLNEWAARDLHAAPGDRIRISYYVTRKPGQLTTETAAFRLRGVVRLAGAAADPGFTPEYPGVTDTESVADWNPPFPLDLRKVRDNDEAYWDQFRSTPKAFVSLADGQRLWATQPDRLGRITSLRVYAGPEESLERTHAAFERALLDRVDPGGAGLAFDDVRSRMLAASRGSTDFGGLFIGFSFFLIVSAALLVALLFRLGVERRSGEVGLLLALGYAPRRVARLLLAEGVLLAAIGAAAGLAAARGYAWLMLAGLRSWWAGAVSTPFLQLHDSPASYLLGYCISLVVATVSIAGALRGLTRLPARALLAGAVQSGRRTARSGRRVAAAITGTVAIGLAGSLSVLTFLTDAVSQSIAFFCSGAALLVACIAALKGWLAAEPRGAIRTAGRLAMMRMGLRNARRRSGRSVLTAGLIASASFLIAALQSMRLEAPAGATDKNSGTGGAALYGESAVPLPVDLGSPAGQAALGLSDDVESALAGAAVVPFRLREGDETSCLNLYRPDQPRILGAGATMIERGGFAFSRTLAESQPERSNPWKLLHRKLSDGAIPVIADEAAVLWQLHSKLGGDLSITDERGRDVRLRFVALLTGSFLQGELIIAEEHFTRLFPSIEGYGFFLIDCPPGKAPRLERLLERDLTNFGFTVASPRQRLAELLVVQNTYLSTFETLGGLGLLLGTLGLAAVLLRNLWERRSELALLTALGYSRRSIGWLVMSEHVFLVAAGLLGGLLSAALVVAPHLASRPGMVPWASLLIMFLAVFVTGALAALAALIPALRARLLPALRSE